MSSGKVKCTCGWSWNKSDSSKKDMYICHECGRDNSNNMKNGGWLDNYNDSEVSLPEGYVGEGYNTSGRDFSPAWGGQFEDGGLIPMAQKGKKVKPIYVESKNDPRYKAYQDSLRMYNYAQLQKQVEGVKNYKRGYNPPGFFGPDHADFEKHNFKALDDKTLEKLHKIYKDEKDGHYSKMTISQFKDVTKKMYNKANEITKSPNIAYINNASSPDLIAKNNDPIATYFGLGLNYDYAQPNQPIEVKKKETPKPTTTKETTKSKPITEPQQKEVNVKPQLQPRVEALSLRPIEQTPINIPVQELDFNTPIKAPKSYNVSSQRTNVNGINDFYNNVQQGVDYEQALKSKQSADAYNKYIQEKYGNEDALKNPKAVERLKQLRQNVEVTPVFQKGGKVFKKTVSESTAVGKNRIPVSSKDVIKKVPGTKVYKDVYGNLLEKDDKGVYKPRQKEKEEVRKHVPQSKLSKAKEIALNPMTAAGYKVRNEDIPENFSRSEDTRNNLDTAVDFINPAWYAESAKNLVQNQGQVFSDVSEGNFQDAEINQLMAGVEALNFIPLAKGAKPLLNKGMQRLGNIPTNVAPELKEFIPTNSNIKQLVNTKINNTSKAIEEHMSGLQQGLFSKTDKRPFFEKFPITKSQKAKVYAEQDKALEEGEQFIKDWHYGDDIDLHPDIVKRMQELDPNFNLSIYDNTNITDPANPFAATNNVLSSTRRNILKNENLSDYAKEYILDNRNKIGGVNIKDTNESITLRNRGLYHYSPSSIKDTVIHEAGHTSENLGTLSYRDPNGNIVWGTKPFNNIRTYDPDLTDYYIANPNTEQGKIFQEAMVEPTPHIKDADGKITKRGYTWEASPAELHSELLPARSNLIDAYVDQGQDRKEIMDMLRADPSDDQIDWMIASKDLNRFFKKTTSPELKRKAIRMLYTGVPTSVGIGAASQMGEEKPVPGMRKGGIIKDDMGQWNHPGEITEIGSNQITMQGVPYPVLGVSDEGDVQMMYPEEEYKFKGKKVTEFPMAKNGIRQEQKGLVNLDQLTNFTNYNTKQPGGWMDKYQ